MADELNKRDLNYIPTVSGLDSDTEEIRIMRFTNNKLDVNTVSEETTNVQGNVVSVGTTAVELTFTVTTDNITITAHPDNTGIIYVGKSDVASDGSNAITALIGGQTVTLEGYNDDTNAIYAVASVAAQKVIKGTII